MKQQFEGGQGGNVVYTFGLVTGFLRLVYERRLDKTAP